MNLFSMRSVKGLALVLVAAVMLIATGIAGAKERSKWAPGDGPTDPMPYIQEVTKLAKKYQKDYELTGLQFGKVDAFTINGQTFVRVPGPNYGGVLVAFEGKKAVNTFVMDNQIKKGIVTSNVWTDGNHIANVVSNEATGDPIEGWVIGPDGSKVDVTTLPKHEGDISTLGIREWWDCFNSCMSALAVPSWLLGLIGTICGIACIGTAGIGCLICLQGVLIGYLAELSFCWGYCQSRW